jgi:hypothetical protein
VWRLLGQAHGNAEVLKCLVKVYAKLADGCQREMSRAVRIRLQFGMGLHFDMLGHCMLGSCPEGCAQRLLFTHAITCACYAPAMRGCVQRLLSTHSHKKHRHKKPRVMHDSLAP